MLLESGAYASLIEAINQGDKMMKKVALFAAMSLVSSIVFAGDDAPVKFNDVDTNQDGQISKQEAASFASVESTFDKADTNKNGKLDWKEFAQGTNPEKRKTR